MRQAHAKEATMQWIRLVPAGIAMATAMLAGTAAAQPGWSGGVHFGWGPPHPHYRPYAPSYHYTPPPAPVAQEGCYAGPYVCPLEGPARLGMPCSCPTAQGPAWGRAR
jgi:hypothetical protein